MYSALEPGNHTQHKAELHSSTIASHSRARPLSNGTAGDQVPSPVRLPVSCVVLKHRCSVISAFTPSSLTPVHVLDLVCVTQTRGAGTRPKETGGMSLWAPCAASGLSQRFCACASPDHGTALGKRRALTKFAPQHQRPELPSVLGSEHITNAPSTARGRYICSNKGALHKTCNRRFCRPV